MAKAEIEKKKSEVKSLNHDIKAFKEQNTELLKINNNLKAEVDSKNSEIKALEISKMHIEYVNTSTINDLLIRKHELQAEVDSKNSELKALWETNVLSNSAAVRGSVEVGGEVELTTFKRRSRARTISAVPDENERNHIQEMMETGEILFAPSETVSGGDATVVENPLANYFSGGNDDAANTSGNSMSVGGGGGGGGGEEKMVSKIERERLQRLVLMRKKVGRRNSIGGRRNSVGGRRRSSVARQKKSNK